MWALKFEDLNLTISHYKMDINDIIRDLHFPKTVVLTNQIKSNRIECKGLHEAPSKNLNRVAEPPKTPSVPEADSNSKH